MFIRKAVVIIRTAIALLSCALILIGAVKGGYKDVKNKANTICYECIGIG